MNRRRRASSIASRATDEEVESSPVDSIRKKRRVDPVDIVQSVYDTLRNFKKEDGTLLCDSFIRAPKRRQEPTYYDVVTNPIDLIKIQQKIKTEEYDDIDDLQADLELLINNAKSFYKKNSQEYKDASDLWDLFESTKNNLLDREETPKEKLVLRVGKLGKRGGSSASMSKSEQTDEEESNSSYPGGEEELTMYEDLFTAVMSATDNDNRPLSAAFQLLPSKKRYPNYYEVIENPIDLRSIARKIQDGKYSSLAEMERELLLMTKNACLFNEPGSQIYKDAKSLKKVITSKKIEVDHGKYAPSKSSERIRAKRLRGGQTSMSAITAALQSEDEEDSDLDEDTVTDSQSIIDGPDNPRWQLYNAVRSATGLHGNLLSDSFWKLPSKRYYPNYYHEIRNPLSLMQIGKKLKNGDYGTVSEVAGDMNIMLENAKKYFASDTKQYKDAVKLQKIMQTKAQELLDLGHQYSDSEDDSADDELNQTVRHSKKFNRSPRCLTRGKYLNNIPLKRRLYALCKCLMDYTTEHGRVPMLMFMERPSKKLYPDYYKVIAEPIDMLTIEEKIKQEKYNSEEEILRDFKLMFNNCRQFNEEGSLIYEDANTLEKVLLDRSKELGPVPSKPTKIISSSVIKLGKKPQLPQATLQKMRTLFNTIKDFKDQKGRLLSIIFMKLPSKNEYPDYYEVIKRPIHLEVIAQKLKNNLYESLDDLAADFVLMFDNACKYNEPDSQIYKDALTLQRLTLQTKLQLRADEDSTPDVQSAVQELLTSLFTSVYNHQDEEGRCFSDSMAELPEHDDIDGNKVRGLSLDLIKRRLDGNQYKRLDTFQDDLFACLERARQLSRTDSQVFEDSIELQSYFIRQRDEVCRNGDLLNSPALNYSLLDLSLSVNDMRERKMAEESISGISEEDELKTEDITQEEQENGEDLQPQIAGTTDDSVCVNQLVYRVGDFVYAEPQERGQDPMILNIQRLWTNQEGQQMLYGNQFYRPSETYHLSTRKFLEKEVFKTDLSTAIPVSRIKGRCAVVSVKDYFRYQPKGFDEKDVYVCESRYSSRCRNFKKIKNWASSLTATWNLVERDEPLDPKRIMSVFRDRVEKHKEEIAELEEHEKILEKEKPNIVMANPSGVIDDGSIYYEQYNTQIGVLKPGDFVYVKNDEQNQIIQIDRIWVNKQGIANIYGPILLTPSEIPNMAGRQYFKQEALLTNIEETVVVSKITGKCSVLEHAEYISCRPAEIAEADVYLCESIYDDSTKQIRELPKDGLKKYTHSPAVNQDEFYFFRRLIHPVKIGAPESHLDSKAPYNHIYDSVSGVSSPIMPKLEPADTMTEDSMDGGPPSVSSSDLGERTLNTSTIISTPSSSRKKNPNHKKLVTGYILYTSDVRKAVAQNNPDRSFGEVSRIVGNEWRNLSPTEKMAYEERANRLNEENYPQWRQQNIQAPPPEGSDLLWECGWDNCDWQFEDQADCLDHAVADQYGHVQTFFAAIPPSEIEYQCQWRGCLRVKKTGIAPFPSLHRLVRHVKEVHILKNPGRSVPLSERNKNCMSTTRSVVTTTTSALSVAPPSPPQIENSNVAGTIGVLNQVNRNTPSPLSQNGTTGNNGVNVNKHLEPIFVTVPPKPTRVFHSEAYIKYIESLNLDSKPSWERQLYATQENTKGPDDPNSLPAAQWLGKGIGNHGNVLNALWALRNFMMKDAMGLSKTDD
ncbi:protein polybromo-1 isoform X2 [Adelges cooleyi]|uniref:protein polybromo-1 isoform X2 n=1 Tax=Adelges cooleyi TaxID=133065 RepID=UPI00217F43A0|nr:protein polybromo-1 isoform X2 [Adelges cooleyi]